MPRSPYVSTADSEIDWGSDDSAEQTGTVRRWDGVKGWGFLQSDVGEGGDTNHGAQMALTAADDTTPHCIARNADGVPCGSTFGLSADSLCPAHAPGGRERLASIASSGGAATAAKHAGQAFAANEITVLESFEDAKRAFDDVRRAVLTRRITHTEGNAATKAIEGWIKAETAGITRGLVNELRAELDARGREIEQLRGQVTSQVRAALRAS